MKKIFLFVIFLIIGVHSEAQNVGLSFSYFVPRNGYFSTPISPFSLRGIGFNFNNYFGVQTGVTLYRMSGLNIIDLPFESKEPLLGPNFTIFVPAEFVFQLKGQKVKFDIKAGGFLFYGFAQKLNTGNIDRAIRQYNQWDVTNSDLSFKNNPGFGKQIGTELTVYVTNQFGISLETNYLMGTAKFPLSGSYTGGTMTSGLQSVTVDYKDAKVDFTGFEFSVGVIFTGGGGGQKPKVRRRR
ncbi:MAG: hypothetical protein HY015_00420 [Bacteroidetes bacterium]|nr:hypothetical protein [Bacteroidota bacterium]MBI3481442.1 hypothetical protein [Bacteroidota bacterium]